MNVLELENAPEQWWTAPDPERRPRSGGLPPRRPLPWRRALSLVSAALLAFVLWLAFAPPLLGGSTSYVITQGISMLPNLHAGDVVILRSETSYHVGEVAAYHNAELGEVVLHRIVAIENGHFEFKGDNNLYPDTYEPTRHQIVGAEWIVIPGAGKVLETLRVPLIAALGLAALWVLSFSHRRRSRRQMRRHRHGR